MPINIETVDQIVKKLNSRLTSFFEKGTSEPWNTNPNTPNGNLVRAWAVNLNLMYLLLQYVYQSSKFNQATGVDLENLVSLLGIHRRQSSITIPNVSLTGQPNSTIPAGSLASTTGSQTFTDTFLFYLVEDVLLDSTGTGTGTFKQYGDGVIPGKAGVIPSGSLNKVVTYVKDISTKNQTWYTVKNISPSSASEELESDLALRERMRTAVSNTSSGYVSTVRSIFLSSHYVYNAKVYMNTGASTGIPSTQPIHSLFPIGLWEPNSAEVRQEIANALALSVPPVTIWDGVDPSGTNPPVGASQYSIDAELPNGQTIRVGMALARETEIHVHVQLEFTIDEHKTIKDILRKVYKFFNNPFFEDVDHVDNASNTRGLDVGQILVFANLLCEVNDPSNSDYEIKGLFVKKDADPAYSVNDLPCELDEVLTFKNVVNLTVGFNQP